MMPMTPSPKSMSGQMPPAMRKVVGEVQAASDEMLLRSVPQFKFSADSLNQLITALNSGMSLFGAKAKPIQRATKPGTIPVEVMRVLFMLDTVAADMGREPLTAELENVTEDGDMSMIAGLVESFLADSEVRAHLRAPAAPPMLEEPVEEGAPEGLPASPSPINKLKDLMQSRKGRM